MTTTTFTDTDENTRTLVTGAYGQLSTDESEQMLIELVRDYLAGYRPDRFMPNWDRMNTGDQVMCLTVCANSEAYMMENFLQHAELKTLADRLECITEWTDAEPDRPEEFLKGFQAQADRRSPDWANLPDILRRRFTDYFHHSVALRETGKLSWLDVEMMMTFGQRHGHFTGMPVSSGKRLGRPTDVLDF